MMMNDPIQTPKEPEKKKDPMISKEILDKIWRGLTKNWGMKLLCLAMAVILWGVLVSQDTAVPRPKTIKNVKVTATNTSSLRQNGFIVVSGLEDLGTRDIQVQVPQKYYNAAAPTHYSVRLDLSQIREAGEQTVALTGTSTNTTMYGSVSHISNPQVQIVVEEYETRTRIPVQLIVTGEGPEGLYASNPICDPDTVDIGGPKSIVDRVVRCVATYDMSALSDTPGTVRTSVSFSFQDMEGNELDDTNLTVTTQSVALRNLVVDQVLYPKAEVKISKDHLLLGQPAPGYQVTDVKIYPETLEIAAGDISRYLEEGALIFPSGRLNIAGEKQGITGKLTISRPSGVVYMSTYEITVMVSIAPAAGE